MLKLYDTVRIKATGQVANIVEIDDNNGQSPPIYLVEMQNVTDDMDFADIVKWVDYSEIAPLKQCGSK